ncbi:IS200/IS605 family accessory protein TnpB-related protein [Virgibacillus necropolis]|uniref:Transposase n=1 Tax=Virgibacillus necropolis TaxID=163877 RepID=A0A221MB49_9BACI|nr:IS200/IS605 family accessory protein TnpB-related protein [Virgibacillus necropolis]ASN04863.1 transposase [Virgibacillus necropolis]
MEKTKTIKNKILSHGTISFEPTLIIYRNALKFIVEVIDEEWILVEGLSTKEVTRVVEKLIHRTKDNPSPEYDFTSTFYKFPSYLRRSAISKAFGIVTSYRSNLKNWQSDKLKALSDGKAFTKKPPVLSMEHDAFPVFYKGNMFNRISSNRAEIKLFINNDWVWHTITFNDKNLKNRGILDWKENNPTLIKVGKKYFINFSCTKKVKVNKTKINEQTIIAVDLGLTNSAVCSAMRSNGTVIGRKFINQPIEKDRMNTIIGKLKKAQRSSGKIEAPNFWRRINGLQNYIKVNTASEIIKFAEEYNASVVVFEYLGKMRVPKDIFGAKRIRHKLHHWCKLGIQSKVEEMAHYRGMRIRRVNPKYTSALAFDGSGKVKRNTKKDLATFQNGKVYHADLSASYNIGARYFIKEILKPFSEKKRLAIQAKVPELLARTRLTLASLISLHQALRTNGAKPA